MTPTFLTSAHGERYLHDVNRDTFAAHRSAQVFDRRLDTDLDAEDTLYVIVGTDSGLLVRWLAGRTPGDGSRFLFVELDEYHEPVRESLGATIDGLTIGTSAAADWEAALLEREPARYLYAGRIVLVESVGCVSGYAPGYAPLARRMRTWIGELVHSASLHVNTRLFMEVQLRNAADNLRPAATVGRIGEGCTAIVLGGGPSLDDHLDWVLEHRDELFVIAVSRIVGKLSGVGLVPDAVAAIDPEEALLDISREGLELEGIPLVSSYHVCAPLLQQWRGPTLYTGRALPWESPAIGDAENVVARGSTVSHAALELAFRWGFAQILLSGVDLCYAPGGVTHATGSIESLCTTLPAYYDLQVATYGGRRAGTAMPLKLGRDELEHMGRDMAGAGVRVYNLSRDAAAVDSIAHRPAESIELGTPRPVLDVGADATDAESRRLAVRGELLAAKRGLREVMRACVEAGRCLDGLHGRRGRAPDYRHKKKLDALDRNLERRSKRWMLLIKLYGAQDLVRTAVPRGFDAMSDDELERWGREYYRIVSANAKRLLELVTDADERIEHRLLEAKPAASVTRLLDYWRRDRTLGRVVTVLGPMGTSAALCRDERQAIETARSEHAAALAAPETAFAKRHSARQSDAGQLLCTIGLLFAEADSEDLGRLAAGLDTMGDRWAVFASWAHGQCAELADDTTEALERYRRILDLHSTMNEKGIDVPPGAERLLEDVLIRIVNLELVGGDAESALAGLTILSHLSPAYLTRQARLLGLMGRHVEAADLLQGMIGSGAGDWRTAAQLADLYESLGSDEAAEVASELAERMRHGPVDGVGNRRAA